MMTKQSSIIISFFIMTFFSAQANTYYIAKDGDDQASGSINQAWRSIQKAANTLVAGDTVFIKAGIYNERISVQNSGTADQFIVFINYMNDEVIIDGSDIIWWDWNGLFDITDRSYISVLNLKLKNSYYGGFWIENSHHIIIENNKTYNTVSCGIGVWESNDITIHSNEVELACNDGEQECISIANSHHCEILQNHIHHNGPGTNGGEGIDVKAGSHDILIAENTIHHLNNRIGIYADAWDAHTYNITISRNKVYHCLDSGIAIASERGGLIEYVRVVNNISYDNKWGGIELGGWTNGNYQGATPVRHILFVNNTCYQNGSIDDGWGFGIKINNSYAEDITIRNNICSRNNAQIGVENILSNLVIDHNLIDGNNDVEEAVFGSDSIVGDALFMDANAANFHLLENSPAIDNGSSLDAPSEDFDKHQRPDGGAFDIGAFERNSSSGIDDNTLLESEIRLFPNPCTLDRLSIMIENQSYNVCSIKIFNSSGYMVKELKQELVDNTIVIDRDGLVEGLYIVNIQLNNRLIANRKLLIQ